MTPWQKAEEEEAASGCIRGRGAVWAETRGWGRRLAGGSEVREPIVGAQT